MRKWTIRTTILAAMMWLPMIFAQVAPPPVYGPCINGCTEAGFVYDGTGGVTEYSPYRAFGTFLAVTPTGGTLAVDALPYQSRYYLFGSKTCPQPCAAGCEGTPTVDDEDPGFNMPGPYVAHNGRCECIPGPPEPPSVEGL